MTDVIGPGVLVVGAGGGGPYSTDAGCGGPYWSSTNVETGGAAFGGGAAAGPIITDMDFPMKPTTAGSCCVAGSFIFAVAWSME